MKQEIIIENLETRKFEYYSLDNESVKKLRAHNITIMSSETKLIFIKEFRTQGAFLNWEYDEQILILNTFRYLPRKFDNNIYFLMILDFNPDNIVSRLEINRIEKNDLVCKKYVLQHQQDLERIPFMNYNISSDNFFEFDQKFKENIKAYQYKNEANEIFNIEKLLDNYFKNLANNEETEKINIEDLIGKGDGNVH